MNQVLMVILVDLAVVWQGVPNGGGNHGPQTIDGSGNTPDLGIGYPGGDGGKTFLTLVVVQVVASLVRWCMDMILLEVITNLILVFLEVKVVTESVIVGDVGVSPVMEHLDQDLVDIFAVVEVVEIH